MRSSHALPLGISLAYGYPQRILREQLFERLQSHVEQVLSSAGLLPWRGLRSGHRGWSRASTVATRSGAAAGSMRGRYLMHEVNGSDRPGHYGPLAWQTDAVLARTLGNCDCWSTGSRCDRLGERRSDRCDDCGQPADARGLRPGWVAGHLGLVCPDEDWAECSRRQVVEDVAGAIWRERALEDARGYSPFGGVIGDG